MFGRAYHSAFHPLSYLEYFTTTATDFTFQRLALECYHEAFRTLPSGLSVLDYGTGPIILSTISAASKAESIVLSDYTDSNRKALHQWLSRDPLAFDWTPHFKYVVCQLEGGDEKEAEKRQEDVRRLVKAVADCDLSQDPPIERTYSEQFYDVVMTSFCLCCAAQSHEEYRLGIAKLGKLVKPGGILTLYDAEIKSDSVETRRVGETDFMCVGVTREFVVNALSDAGFSDICVRSCDMDADDPDRKIYPNRLGYLYVQGKRSL